MAVMLVSPRIGGQRGFCSTVISVGGGDPAFSPAARPDLGIRRSKPKPIGCQECRTRSIGCHRTGTAGSRYGTPSTPKPAGLVFDQLQIGPSQLDSGQRGDLSGIDRIHLLEAVL